MAPIFDMTPRAGGGGSAVQTGTFTPDAREQSHTITVTGTLSHILIFATEALNDSDGTNHGNSVALAYTDDSEAIYIATLKTNSAASSFNTTLNGGLMNNISAIFANGSITITTPVYFGVANYRWYAW